MKARAIPIFVSVVLACGAPAPHERSEPLELPASPAETASAAKRPSAPESGPLGLIHDAIPHFQELLARGEDERFIDEVVDPDELAKVLGGRSKADLVSTFRTDKHAAVVRILQDVAEAKPKEVREENGRTIVKFEGGEHARDITFVVVGKNVYIKN